MISLIDITRQARFEITGEGAQEILSEAVDKEHDVGDLDQREFRLLTPDGVEWNLTKCRIFLTALKK